MNLDDKMIRTIVRKCHTYTHNIYKSLLNGAKKMINKKEKTNYMHI